MSALAVAGLVVALLGVPATQFAFRLAGANPWGLMPRLAMWLVAAAALLAAILAVPGWPGRMGLHHIDWRSLGDGVGTGILVLLVWPLLQVIQRAARASRLKQAATFRTLVALSAGYRFFLLVTATVVEEVLYRGYAIGVGDRILGNDIFAAVLSLAVFTAAHYRWGTGHLVNVVWAGGMLTALFHVTHDLYACMIAHFIVDAVGLLVIPAAASPHNG